MTRAPRRLTASAAPALAAALAAALAGCDSHATAPEPCWDEVKLLGHAPGDPNTATCSDRRQVLEIEARGANVVARCRCLADAGRPAQDAP